MLLAHLGLVLDMTNFATYLDSGNDKAPIAQRGKAKQKRTDLRLVGLALVVTRDGGIPLLSHAYPGDRPDVTQFSTVITELVQRYRDLASGVEFLTVVYDAGQNSGPNHAVIEDSTMGFIGSLPPSQHPDLLALPATRYEVVDAERYPGLTCLDTRVTALGVNRRAVLTHSPSLHSAQSRGFTQTLAKARRRLLELQATLARGNTRRDRAGVEAEIAAITKPRWVAQVIITTLTGDTPANLRLTFRSDARARTRLEKTLFGKAGPVHQPRRLEYRGRRRRLPLPVRGRGRVHERPPRRVLRPMRHWTESKIRVHVFYCVLALSIAHLMRCEAGFAQWSGRCVLAPTVAKIRLPPLRGCGLLGFRRRG